MMAMWLWPGDKLSSHPWVVLFGSSCLQDVGGGVRSPLCSVKVGKKEQGGVFMRDRTISW